MTEKKRRGDAGEAAALAHYEADGYRLVERNFRSRFGEIDLILARGGMYIFAEVKARGPQSLGTPGESVGYKKQRRIIAAAKEYLALHGLSDPYMRFDVVEVLLKDGAPVGVRRIENAYM